MISYISVMCREMVPSFGIRMEDCCLFVAVVGSVTDDGAAVGLETDAVFAEELKCQFVHFKWSERNFI